MMRVTILAAFAAAVLLAGLPSAHAESGTTAGGRVLLAAADEAAAEAPVLRLHDALLAAMKAGDGSSFADRKGALEPVIVEAFNLPEMAAVASGPFWGRMSQQERDSVIAAFSDFSVATYTSRFDDFDGQRFEIVGQKAGPQDSIWVLTRLVGGGDPVSLNYLVRPFDGAWRIVDVYLKGSISELANRRSEFTSTLRRSGVAGLLKALSEGSDRMANEA